jgi:hypothetical protein
MRALLGEIDMDTFTASNDVEITVKPERDETYLLGKGGPIEGGDRRWTVATANMDGINALREFFQAERDEELGRWRSPEHPNVTCNEHDGAIFVTDERDGRQLLMRRGDEYPSLPEYTEAARAYFEAHPEREDWEDAKPGDIWVITLEGYEVAYQSTSSFAGHVYLGGADDTIELNSTMITAARRIWPEVS